MWQIAHMYMGIGTVTPHFGKLLTLKKKFKVGGFGPNFNAFWKLKCVIFKCLPEVTYQLSYMHTMILARCDYYYTAVRLK